MLKLERINDYLLLEKEFIETMEKQKPKPIEVDEDDEEDTVRSTSFKY